jgi:hypothetical protein
MPNCERVLIRLTDLYHVLVDSRIARHPDRIGSAIASVYEMYLADNGCRRGLSRWMEGTSGFAGYIIIAPAGTLQTMHVIDARRERKLRRQGEQLWSQR